jgi:signal transduction histidine kinase
VLGYVFRYYSIDGLVRTQEQANVNLTTVFANHLWPRDFGPYVRAMEGRTAGQLKAAPEVQALHRKVLELMRGSNTFKVKVYDTSGMTVYSTELKQIGEDKRKNEGVVAGLRGDTKSELTHRNTFSALEGEVQERDLIQSYIPQYDASRKVVGVFEVYSDVTALLREVGEDQWYVMGAVVALLTLLYLVLFVIVDVAQRIIFLRRRQERERTEVDLSRRKSEFLSAAAHELRTPMTSIYGFSDLLRTRDFDRDTARDVVDTIHTQAGRLVHLLNELLDLSRIEASAEKAFNFERQPLPPIVESSIAELLVPGDPRKVKVQMEPGLPELRLDRDKMRQSVTNLLTNAYKYSRPDKDIELKVFCERAGGTERVGIRVVDQGMGMSAQELASFGERFWRSENASDIPGSGLGMSLVKEIMAFHHGSVEVRSEPGKGTEITLWLPC